MKRVILLLFFVISAQAFADTCIQWNSGFPPQIGNGYRYNADNEQFLPESAFKEVEIAVLPEITKNSLWVQTIESNLSSNDKLDFSLDGSLNLGRIDSDFSTKYLRERGVNNHSINILIHGEIRKTPELIRRKTVDEVAKSLLKRSVDNFQRCYGTHYISSVTRGSDFYGNIKFSCANEEVKEQLKAELGISAHGMAWNTEIESKISKLTTSSSSNVSISMDFQIVGGTKPVKFGLVKKLDDMLQIYNETIPDLIANPIILGFGITEYSTVPALNAIDGEHLTTLGIPSPLIETYRKLEKYFQDMILIQNDLAFMKGNTGAFAWDPSLPVSIIDDWSAKIDLALQNVQDIANDLRVNRIKFNDQKVKDLVSPAALREKMQIPNRWQNIFPEQVGSPDTLTYSFDHGRDFDPQGSDRIHLLRRENPIYWRGNLKLSEDRLKLILQFDGYVESGWSQQGDPANGHPTGVVFSPNFDVVIYDCQISKPGWRFQRIDPVVERSIIIWEKNTGYLNYDWDFRGDSFNRNPLLSRLRYKIAEPHGNNHIGRVGLEVMNFKPIKASFESIR